MKDESPRRSDSTKPAVSSAAGARLTMPRTDDPLFDRIAAFTAINAACDRVDAMQSSARRINVQSATGNDGLPKRAMVSSHGRMTVPYGNQRIKSANRMGETDDSHRFSPPVFSAEVVGAQGRGAIRLASVFLAEVECQIGGPVLMCLVPSCGGSSQSASYSIEGLPIVRNQPKSVGVTIDCMPPLQVTNRMTMRRHLVLDQDDSFRTPRVTARAERPGIRVYQSMRVKHRHHARRQLEDLKDGCALPSKPHRSAR